MKRYVVTSSVLALCVLTLAVPQLKAGDKRGNDDPDFARILTGLKISPVRLNLKGKNLALVGLGSYIVNAQGACNDCHTNPPFQEGGNPFQGQPEKINTENFLAGGMMFGPFVSRNITPDADEPTGAAAVSRPNNTQLYTKETEDLMAGNGGLATTGFEEWWAEYLAVNKV